MASASVTPMLCWPTIARCCWPISPCIARRSFSLSLVKLTRGPGSGKTMKATWSSGLSLIEETRRRRHDRPDRARADVHLIDRDDDLAAVGRREVAGVEGLALVGHLLLGGLDVHLHELGRHHAADFAVDLHGELGGAQIVHRTTAAVHDADVDGDEIDAGAEGRSRRGRGVCAGCGAGVVCGGGASGPSRRPDGSARSRSMTRAPRRQRCSNERPHRHGGILRTGRQVGG